MTEVEMVGCHHQFNGHEFEQALGDGEGQESLESVIPFSCPQSFPASRPLLKNWLFTSGGQNIGASASASVVQMNIQN